MALWWYLFVNFEHILHLFLVFVLLEHVCLLGFKLSNRSCYLSCNRSNHIFKVNTRNNRRNVFQLKIVNRCNFFILSQPAFTCSKSTMETPGQCVTLSRFLTLFWRVLFEFEKLLYFFCTWEMFLLVP